MHASIQATEQNGQLAKTYPEKKINKLLVHLTDGGPGYEIGLCFKSLKIGF